VYYLVLHLSLTKCKSHRRTLIADFRTEIEIPTFMRMHTKYWLKHTEMHTRRLNIHFSYAFIWKHLSICTTAFRFRSPSGTFSLDPSIHADSNFRLVKPQYFTLYSLYASSNCHHSACTQVVQEPWNIKHQSLSSNSLTLYKGLTVQCALRAENLQKNRQRHFLFRIRPSFHLYNCLFVFQHYVQKICNPTKYGKTVLQ